MPGSIVILDSTAFFAANPTNSVVLTLPAEGRSVLLRPGVPQTVLTSASGTATVVVTSMTGSLPLSRLSLTISNNIQTQITVSPAGLIAVVAEKVEPTPEPAPTPCPCPPRCDSDAMGQQIWAIIQALLRDHCE